MKIKQTVSLDRKPILAAFIGTLLCTLILRFYHIISLIEPQTGFFKSTNATVIIFYALLALGCFFLGVSGYLKKETMPASFPNGRSKALGISSAVCAVGFFIDFFQSIATAAMLDAESVGTGNLSGGKALMKTGALPTLLQGILAVFCAVYFIFVSVGYFKGNAVFSKRKFLALMPIGWGVLRMISRFVRQISFLNVSDLFLELCMISLLLIFFMAFAQLASGIYSEGVLWRVAGAGLPAAVLCVITALPRLVFTLAGKASSYIGHYHPLYFIDLALAVFIVLLVLSKPAEEAQTEPEEEPVLPDWLFNKEDDETENEKDAAQTDGEA